MLLDELEEILRWAGAGENMEADVQLATFFLDLGQSLGHEVVDPQRRLGVFFRRHRQAVDDVKGQVVLHGQLLRVQHRPVVLNLERSWMRNFVQRVMVHTKPDGKRLNPVYESIVRLNLDTRL